MNDDKPTTKFWIGNGVLALALLLLLFMGQLWEVLGAGAMVLWGAVVAVGVYLLMNDKGGPSGLSG
ncbi:MAG: hypothetical protein ABFS08_03080 [Pseudomonadota bacterium]